MPAVSRTSLLWDIARPECQWSCRLTASLAHEVNQPIAAAVTNANSSVSSSMRGLRRPSDWPPWYQ